MKTLTSGGGYLIIDHKESPGLTPEDVAKSPGAIAVGAGQFFETDTKICSHCSRQVIIEIRTKGAQPAVCPKCHAFICKRCDKLRMKTHECIPMLKRIEEAVNISQKFVGQPDHPDARPDIVLTDLV